jgi:hypothetical protein
MGRVLDERTREVTELIAGISSCEKALEDAVARRAPSNEVIRWYNGAMTASRARKEYLPRNKKQLSGSAVEFMGELVEEVSEKVELSKVFTEYERAKVTGNALGAICGTLTAFIKRNRKYYLGILGFSSLMLLYGVSSKSFLLPLSVTYLASLLLIAHFVLNTLFRYTKEKSRVDKTLYLQDRIGSAVFNSLSEAQIGIVRYLYSERVLAEQSLTESIIAVTRLEEYGYRNGDSIGGFSEEFDKEIEEALDELASKFIWNTVLSVSTGRSADYLDCIRIKRWFVKESEESGESAGA